MPSTSNNDNSSPSASSIFLPLGLRKRRDSKSSLSTEMDKDALDQALNTIHTAASQSQVLTVFNEFTEPPPSASKDDGKLSATDLQSGLTGLYNKIKASVGAAKEENDIKPNSGTSSVHARTISKASSGQTSHIHSPRTPTFDTTASSEAQVPTHPPTLSAKAMGLAKSLQAPAALKSPPIPASGVPHFADPALTEVNIHANGSAAHSRTGSSYEAAEDPRLDKASYALPTEPLQKLLSRTAAAEPVLSPPLSQVTSPVLAPRNPVKPAPPVLHRRGESDLSSKLVTSSKSTPRPTSPVSIPDDLSLDAAIDGRQERIPQPRDSNPLTLLGEHTPRTPRTPPVLSPKITRDGSRQHDPPLSAKKSPIKIEAHLVQSRLPGFSTSRPSSVSSDPSNTLPRVSHETQSLFDGTHDIRSHQPIKSVDKLRSKLLSREFWMRDDNARDCFHCGEPFTTFRRKHHCRTCGQIFDNRCTSLINGSHFGSSGAVRVCKPCEAIIMSHDDDSSDYSADELPASDSNPRPRTPDPASLIQSLARYDDDNISIVSQSVDHIVKTPTMSFPVRRAYEATDRSSRVLEFEGAGRPLPRPSSSRSLKASHSIGHGHKRHHSRHQHIRTHKAYHDDRAPFQRRTLEDVNKDGNSAAFHRDSIIDPDLAQYLSDDASSDEDQSLSMGLRQEREPRPEEDRSAISGLLAAVRKGRSRIADRSIAGFLNIGRDADTASILSSRNPDQPRRKRNLSVASSVHQRLTPRATKERLQVSIAEPQNASPPSQAQPFPRISRMIRSASMHGVGAPAMELNRASIQHVHKMLKQQLKDAGVQKIEAWEQALIPILLRATDDVDPDVQAGDDIDIRNYVKLKKIPGGKPVDTAYISGLIFTKNVALKSMSRLIMGPRILIVTFAIEYARHEQHFMSLDPVIRQEREYLANLVNRIAALKPDILLAQRNISGLALELLDKANIATIFNVKSSVLEAISRCTQTRVVHSMDKLGAQSSQLGTCESFEIKTFVAEGRKKTYVYFSGCPPQLGCTIAIRGADRNMLSKIKRITEFMIYVVYNLKLETCLMRDEWALIPFAGSVDSESKPESSQTDSAKVTVEVESTRSSQIPASTPLAPDVNEATGKAPAEKPEEEKLINEPTVTTETADNVEIPDDIPVPTFYEDMADKHQTKILSASPFVKFSPPYLLMRARELERRVAYLKRLRDQDLSFEQNVDEKARSQKFTLIQPEMLHTSLAGTSKAVREIIHAVHDTEYDKALHNYESQKKQWEAYLSGNRNLFDPYAHQNIVVLFSFVSTATSVPCSGPDMLAFSFYNEHENEDEFEADCTLGQYVEDLCYRANDMCTAESCEKKMYEHHRQYVHGEAQITVFVQPYAAKMRGLQDVILMWSQCKVCGIETTVTPMSSSTWKYSFGKYLELSFWSADLHARAGVCPHDLHRDHLRYFGYKDFALRVHYDPIDLLEIVVPRMAITWKIDNDLRFRNDVFTRIENRITRFMSSVKLRLKSINVEALLPEKIEACQAEIERLSKRANEEHTMLIRLLQDRYTISRHWEILPLNKALRVTQEKVAEWDNAFAEFEQNYFPSERDIRRLATLQLKKIFLDRDVSVTSVTSDVEGTVTPPGGEIVDEKGIAIDGEKTEPRERRATALSPEKTQDVLQSVLEEHASPPSVDDVISTIPTLESDVEKLPQVFDGPLPTEGVRHLDLAITPASPPTARPQTSDHIIDPKETLIELVPEQALADPNTPTKAEARGTSSPLMTPRASKENAAKGIPARQNGIDKQSSPALLRAHSQPAGSIPIRKEGSQLSQPVSNVPKPSNVFGLKKQQPGPISGSDANGTEKKLSDRLGLSQIKNSKFVKNHSFIPRAISHRKDSRVSNLAKHFEQLSREFERERARERKLRAARSRQSRVYPLAASRPIVEVYKDVDEAVEEQNSSDDIFDVSVNRDGMTQEEITTAEGMQQTAVEDTKGDGFHAEENLAEATETDAELQFSSHAPSEADDASDMEELGDDIVLPDSPEDLLRLSQEDIDLKELQKHERSSLMKMLTNFWAERSSSGWAPLEYPLGASEHVFADCDIIVREDEPSSVIAFALDSMDYKTMLHDIQDPTSATADGAFGHTHDENGDIQADVMHSLLRKTGTHLKYQFAEGPSKMLCKIFFAEQFDAVRRKCGVADRIVESLARCLKWDSKGGKTKSLFLKTLDDRFVLKSLSPVETQSFLKFAPNYFQIMSEAFFHELPSVIAKMLGFYQIIVKNSVTGVEYNWYLLIMENLFYDRVPTRIFDLKGSMRNRKIEATGERNEVLLDENMVEFIYESPLFAREHSKKLLRSSVHNDTLFLARQNVMDYSLMIAIDEKRKELVVGIIDCIRTYTWDKKLESWIKDRGFAGGGKNRPTVTSPKEYKRRFREAMGRYVLEAPGCWRQLGGGRESGRLVESAVRGDDGEEVEVLS